MTYTLYSLGDSQLLASILNGVAMIHASGDMALGASIGALIGIALLALKGLTSGNGQGFRYTEFVAGLILYLGFFSPTVEVAIEDAYTQEVRLVQGVPLGPAVTGSILSALGYRLTVLFETAFGTPAMTEIGYADTLEVILKVRKSLLTRIETGPPAAASAAIDLEGSLENYLKDCTLTGIDLGISAMDALIRNPDVVSALRFDSKVYVTEIRDGSDPTVMTCSDAWPRIETLLRTTGVPAIEQQLSAILGKSPVERLQRALEGLGLADTTAHQYMLSAFLIPLIEQGVVGRYQESQQPAQAAMLQEAIQQRAIQWSAEQTLFARIIRPMMAWIEGVTFAITPLMAFVILLGSRGIQMVGQYLLMLIWIQLWLPILAVVNLFITLSASGQLAALNAAGFNLPSVLGTYQMDMALQNWLSVGGMLAASTPAIALMLVYGGSITATHFLGRMQGGDFVNEKLLSPALHQNASLLETVSAHQQRPLSGITLAGSETTLPTFSLNRAYGQELSQGKAVLTQKSLSFMSELGRATRRQHQQLQEASQGQAIHRHQSSGQSETDRFLTATGEDFAKRYRESGLSAEDFTALVSGAAGMGLGTSGSKDALNANDWHLRLHAGLASQLQEQFHLQSGQAHEIASGLSETLSRDEGWQRELARSISHDAEHGVREIQGLGLSLEDQSGLRRAANETLSQEQSVRSLESAVSRIGASTSFSAAEVGRRIIEQPDSRVALHHALDATGLRADASELAEDWRQRGLILDREQAYAAAGVALLSGEMQPRIRPLSEADQPMAEHLGHLVLGEAFGLSLPERSVPGPEQHPLWDRAAQLDGVDPVAETAALKAEGPDAGHLAATVADGLARSRTRLDSEADASEAAYDGSRTWIDQRESELRPLFHKQGEEELTRSLHRAAEAPDTAPEKIHDRLVGGLYGMAEKLADLGLEAGKAFIEAHAAAKASGIEGKAQLQHLGNRIPEALGRVVQHWESQQLERLPPGLTPAQTDYYRAALFESFEGLPITGDYHPSQGRLGDARARLNQADPAHASDIARILTRAASQGRTDLLYLLAEFNRHQTTP